MIPGTATSARMSRTRLQMSRAMVLVVTRKLRCRHQRAGPPTRGEFVCADQCVAWWASNTWDEKRTVDTILAWFPSIDDTVQLLFLHSIVLFVLPCMYLSACIYCIPSCLSRQSSHFIHSFANLIIRSFGHSCPHTLIYSFVHIFIHACTRSLMRALIYSCARYESTESVYTDDTEYARDRVFRFQSKEESIVRGLWLLRFKVGRLFDEER